MTELVVKFPALHPAQMEIVSHPARFKVVICGRRFGKSLLARYVIGKSALKTGGPYAYFAPTYKNMSKMWREFKNGLQPVLLGKNEQEKQLRLVTGGLIDFWSLDHYDAVRGNAYAGIVIDEAALLHNGEDAWNAAIRPLLTDHEGWAIFISTPRGRGYLFDLYSLGQSGDNPNWKSFRFPTASNPYVKPGEIEEARLLLPKRLFDQEYLAEWLDDAGGVFRNVGDAAVLEPVAPGDPSLRGGNIIIGADLARLEDFTVVTAIDAMSRKQIAMDRFNRLSWQTMVDRIGRMVSDYGASLLVYDATGVGDAVGEMIRASRFRCRIEGVKFVPELKGNMVENLAVAIERGELKLLNNTIQTNELRAYEMSPTLSGRYRYGAPSGLHDDTVMALCLAWHGITSRSFIRPIILDWTYPTKKGEA